jgi:cytidine deaminase
MSSKHGAEELLALARAFQARAYAPYSNFHVGAVILTNDGHTFGGANVENASFGVGICAERAAAAAAVSAGYREFAEIAVAGPEGVDISPCGACRQFLNEFNPAMRVHCSTRDGLTHSTALDALLPHAFGPQNLK